MFDPPPYYVETTKNELKQLFRDMSMIRLAGNQFRGTN